MWDKWLVPGIIPLQKEIEADNRRQVKGRVVPPSLLPGLREEGTDLYV